MDLPNQWEARNYQQPLFEYMFEGGLDRKRAVEVWHRRAGKDSCCLNLAAVASHLRIGTIWHMLPTLKQGRRVIWDGVDRYGRRMIDQAFPSEMRLSINNSEMQIKFGNGSVYQVVGSDNYDSLVGTNPVGIIMSEYAVADPTAWDYLRPILAENDGWALFIYTPRGKNHGWKMYEQSVGNPKWHSKLLTVDDTHLPDGRNVISEEVIEEERASGMSEEKIQQEYFCSFESGLEGAFYTTELELARKDGRIGEFDHDPGRRVQTWWDIGFRDKTAIGYTQRHESGSPILVNYDEGRNKSLDIWVRDVRSHPYDYESHSGPHDLENHDWTTGKTRREYAEGLQFHFDIVEKLLVQDGIEAVRALLRRIRIDEGKCGLLLDGLYSYKREFDEKANLFRDKPVHDWASHPADMVRYLAVGWVDYGGRDPHSSIQYTATRAVGLGAKRANVLPGRRQVIRSIGSGST